MHKQVTELAFHGNWAVLLPLLKEYPHLINATSESKGYTPLHQAAWHGARLSVVGELLALGADRRIKTRDMDQTPQDIALEQHADRADLEFILAQGERTLAQLMRKVVVDYPGLFSIYDGNKVLWDRLIECFGTDSCLHTNEDVGIRVGAAFEAVAGVALSLSPTIACGPTTFAISADTTIWKDRLLHLLREYTSRAHVIPIEKEWAVISDLFDPAPDQWGRRGDLFLWMEMRQALCHVEIPQQAEGLEQTISSIFAALSGRDLATSGEFQVKRFGNTSASGVMISSEFWRDRFIPLLQKRSQWLQETWGR